MQPFQADFKRVALATQVATRRYPFAGTREAA
jgi:hypothetical protein